MSSREHKLFKQYPRKSNAVLSTGKVPTPYHIYDGHGAFIGGFADLAAVRRLLRRDQMLPVETVDGRALMGIWICDFQDASLGPHHELQFSIFVSHNRVANIEPDRLSLLKVMATRPDIQMMCHGLWNNTSRAVAYNRELLSLNSHLSLSSILVDGEYLSFMVTECGTGKFVCAGRLSNPSRSSVLANFDLFRQLGLKQMWRLSQEPWFGMRIVNPVFDRISNNLTAESYAKNDVTRLRYFDQNEDRLKFGDTVYSQLDFQPQFIQHMAGFKFVYLQPERTSTAISQYSFETLAKAS